MTRITALLSVVVWVVILPVLSSNANEKFEAMKAEHEKKMKELDDRYTLAEESLDLRYASYLQAELKRQKNRGDREGIAKIKSEIARFERQKTMPFDSPMMFRVESARLSRTNKRIPFLRDYLFQLTKLRFSLMKANTPEDTELVKAEIKRVNASLTKEQVYVHSVKMAAIHEGLLLHYDFDKAEEGTIKNLVADDKHAINNGATLKSGTRGKGNQVAELGVDAQIITEQFPSVLPSMTAAVWVRFSEMTNSAGLAATQTILVKGDRLGYMWSWGIAYHKDTLMFTVKDNKPVGLPLFSRKVKPLEWCHIAATWNSRKSVLYLNGRQIEGKANSKPMVKVKTPFKMGGGAGRHLRGQIDDVMIWDRALSEKELTGLYNDQVR